MRQGEAWHGFPAIAPGWAMTDPNKLTILTPGFAPGGDYDAHGIPARGQEPAHIHFDVRFLCEASADAPLAVSDESHALAWLDLDAVSRLNPEESLLRMVRRTPPAASR
jgi:hypothetical protein